MKLTDSWLELFGGGSENENYVDDLVGIGKTLRTFGFENEQLFQNLSRISDAGAVLGWESADMDMIAQRIGLMYQSGSVDRRKLDTLQMRGVNAVGYLARAYGISEEEVYDQRSDFDGREVAEIILEFMGEQFKGGAEA